MRIQSRLYVSLIAAAALALATGCGGPKSQDKVDRDTAKARSEAQENMAETRQDARNEVADARQDAADKLQDANDEAARANADLTEADAEAEYKVAVEQAKGDHDVAVKKCEALPSDQRRSCTDRADADLKAAQARADDVRTHSTSLPD